MSLSEPAAIGYLLSFASYAVLTLRLTRRSGPRRLMRALWIASAATALWSVAAAFQSEQSADAVLVAVKWTRNLAWLTVLLLALSEIRQFSKGNLIEFSTRPLWYSSVALGGVLMVVVVVALTHESTIVRRLPNLIYAALMLFFCEQVLANKRATHGSELAYLCLAAGSIFLYELIWNLPLPLIVTAENGFRQTHGWVLAIFSIPLTTVLKGQSVSAAVEPESRPFVFRWFILMTFLIVVFGLLIADQYVRALGGSWPEVIRISGLAGLACVVAVLAVSSPARARLRVFLTKSFLRYKYDYRREWLRFIGTLSETGLDRLPSASVQAIARIVNSPAGVVWVFDADNGRYSPIGAWHHPLPLGMTFSPDSSLVRFMLERQWIIDLDERQKHRAIYGDLKLDSWFEEDDAWWIIVPMLLGSELYGFVALMKAPNHSTLNFEDHDLLRTVGRHVATHLKQAESDRQLSEAQQFSAYHRLSAFLMHDLNNLVAQLSLVVKNAEKHRRDPKFIDDMIATVANSVSRMNRLLEQLSNVADRSTTEIVDLIAVVKMAIKRSAPRKPRPSFRSEGGRPMISADPERLVGVLEHLIRNAQDATLDDGDIEITVEASNTTATVCIHDNGSGMTDEFINERLFRPFDSTKGSQSMGIGAYQAREYIRALGGQVDVASTPGSGSTFTIRIPLAK